MSHYKPAVR